MENIKLIYLSKQKNHLKFATHVNNAYKITDIVGSDYPKHFWWFWNKLIPDVVNKKREIIIAYKKDIPVGTVFLKNIEEKKICTVMVLKKYRNQGIGTLLIESSFKYLKTTKPIITINEEKISVFENIISKYKWKKTNRIPDCYIKNKIELIYNDNEGIKV